VGLPAFYEKGKRIFKRGHSIPSGSRRLSITQQSIHFYSPSTARQNSPTPSTTSRHSLATVLFLFFRQTSSGPRGSNNQTVFDMICHAHLVDNFYSFSWFLFLLHLVLSRGRLIPFSLDKGFQFCITSFLLLRNCILDDDGDHCDAEASRALGCCFTCGDRTEDFFCFYTFFESVLSLRCSRVGKLR
jgi:hypothetical protein